MSEHDTKDQVRKLLAALQSSATNDPELRALLAALDTDIHRALAGGAAAPDGDLGARARSIAVRFAVRHPRLEPLVEELVNLLASVGI